MALNMFFLKSISFSCSLLFNISGVADLAGCISQPSISAGFKLGLDNGTHEQKIGFIYTE